MTSQSASLIDAIRILKPGRIRASGIIPSGLGDHILNYFIKKLPIPQGFLAYKLFTSLSQVTISLLQLSSVE